MAESGVPYQTRNKVIFLMVITPAAVAAALWFFLAQPKTAKFQPAMDAYTAGQLHVEQNGSIDLSAKFPGLTANNQMYVLRRPDNSFLILFPTYYGKGPAIAGLAYTSRPLQEGDTFRLPYGASFEKEMVIIGPWNRLMLDKKINDHWYEVSYGVQ